MKKEKIQIVVDKFLPEEQREQVHLPEWVAPIQEYMEDAMDHIKVVLAEVVDSEERNKRIARIINPKKLDKIVGKNLDSVTKVDLDFQNGIAQLTVLLKQGKNLSNEMKLTTTFFINKEKNKLRED